MAMIEQITDDEIKNALIEANGQPTKAAEILEVTYPHLYTRIRKNPELLEVQKAYRARTFQTVSNVALTAFLTGVMTEPETDDEGNIIEGQTRKIKIDHRTRLSLIPNLMQTFKSEDGISDKLDITSNGNSINTGFKIEVIDKREDVRTEEEENE